MSVRTLLAGDPGFDVARRLIEDYQGFPLNARRDTDLTLWHLTDGPGTWNDMTEELEGQETIGVLALSDRNYIPEVGIAIHPTHRGRGLATQALQRLIYEDYPQFVLRVDRTSREGLAFAAKHGRFFEQNGTIFTFEVNTETVRIPHLGCHCRTCRQTRSVWEN